MPAVHVGKWRWDPQSRCLTSGSETLDVTHLERDLIAYMVKNAGRPVASDELLREVWKYAAGVKSRAVAHTVARLRKKLGPAGDCLATVRGVGYRLELPDVGGLYGRRALLDETRGRLGQHRLVTLHGLGGAGKTCLAQAVARAVPSAIWVSCEGVSSEASWVGAVAGAVDHAPSVSDPAAIRRFLVEAGVDLLVLDAASQLEGWAVPLLRGWLERDHRLQVLITSRSLLGDEAGVAVGPLAVEPARRLFQERASRVWDQELSDAYVDDVVQQVDRLPLAIELAAARLRVLEPAELAERIARDVRVLGLGSHSMEASLAGSWSLLDPAAGRVLCAASLCSGPVSVQRLEHFVGLPGPVLIDALDTLVRASLLERTSEGLTVLGLVRGFARARLEADLAASFVSWMAERAETAFVGRFEDPVGAQAVMIGEAGLLTTALDLAREPRHIAPLALALRAHRKRYGGVGDVQERLQRLDRSSLPVPLQVDVLSQLASSGAREERQAHAERAHALAQGLGSPSRIAETWGQLVHCTVVAHGARAAADESRRLVAFCEAKRVSAALHAATLAVRADILWRTQEFDEALDTLRHTMNLAHGDTNLELHLLIRTALLHRAMGVPERAITLLAPELERLQQTRRAGHRLRVGVQLAGAHLEAEQPEEATALFEGLLPLATELDRAGPALRCRLGLLELDGDDAAAIRGLRAVIAESIDVGYVLAAAEAELHLGYRHHRRGSLDEAVHAYQAANTRLLGTDWTGPRATAMAWCALAVAELGSAERAQDIMDRAPRSSGVAQTVRTMVMEALGSVRRPPSSDAHLVVTRTWELCRRMGDPLRE